MVIGIDGVIKRSPHERKSTGLRNARNKAMAEYKDNPTPETLENFQDLAEKLEKWRTGPCGMKPV